ncbi:Uncharacterized ATP-dependent helicase MG140 homolog [Durusdinium trenchii]|uniref:Uncharacterized ATP-dependent helicase MG140 homolog n=1 Tax=Durusdinium trenchii TaxID=1381693 RepID=A0ABP0PUR7_9DINO
MRGLMMAGSSSNSSNKNIREDPFVEELFQKLKGDAKQSNFMRAFVEPKNSSNLDLTQLKWWDSGYPGKILKELLSCGEFAEKLGGKPASKSADAMRAQKLLESLVLRNKEDRKDYGVDSLNIGFPLVQTFDEKTNKWLMCPLILWKVRLEMTNGRYSLQREYDDPVQLNDALVQYCLGEFDLDLKKGYERKDHINDVDVEALVLRLLPKLSHKDVRERMGRILNEVGGVDKIPAVPTKLPQRAIVSNAQFQGKVVWGAVLALFKTGNMTILKDLRDYRRRHQSIALASQPVLTTDQLLFSGLPLDPSQFESVKGLAGEQNLVINGPPGTGKSQTLAGVISCAGANGLKVLVVCEKKTPLEILQRKLTELCWNGWTGDKFTALITNVQDREAVVKRAQQNRSDIEQYSDEKYEAERTTVINDILRLRTEIAAEESKFVRHKQINNETVSFNLTMKEAIAFVIQQKLEGHTTLSLPAKHQISKIIFAQDHLMRLDRCQEHLSKEITEALGWIQFTALDLDSSEPFDAEALIRSATRLVETIDAKLTMREESLIKAKSFVLKEMEDEVEMWTNHSEELHDIKEQLQKIPADEINSYDSPSWLSSMRSVLAVWAGSSNKPRLRYFHEALQKIEAQIVERYGAELTMPTNFTMSSIGSTVRWVDKQKKKATERREELEKMETVQLANDDRVSKRVQGLFAASNAEVLRAVKESVFGTLAMQERIQQCLETKDRADCIIKVKKQMERFSRNWLGPWRQAADSIDCLIAFGIVQNEDFFAEFLTAERHSSWGERMKLCILSQEVESRCRELITSDQVLSNLSDALAQIQRKMQILFCIHQAQGMKRAIESHEDCHKQKFEQFYNRGTKGIKVNSLREIVKDIDLFSSCFPVIFCTPEVASTLFKGHLRTFDLVIFDEASQSLTHDAYASLLKGKKVIIAGDSKQMPPTTLFNAGATDYAGADDDDVFVDEDDDLHMTLLDGDEDELGAALQSATAKLSSSSSSVSSRAARHQPANLARNRRNAANAESLLDFATDHSFNFRSIDLVFHYRSVNPDLMGFHCAAIYPNLTLCPERPALATSEAAINVTQVNGVYQDQSNRQEARAIVELLRKFVVQYPGHSIAVATFNDVQKKEILKAIKVHTDVVFLQRLRSLQSSQQFFVKNLENLQGDEVDVLVIGTTFGPNRHGNFDKRFGRITFTGLGYRYLNVLFSRAKKKVHLITSIPEQEFSTVERQLDESGCLSGTSMLFGYLSYAKAVSDKDRERMASILREFSFATPGRDKELAVGEEYTSLENVIYNQLVAKRKEYNPDTVTRATSTNTLLRGILVKLGNQRSLVIECNTYDSYRQSIYRKAILEKFGYEYFQVWPANWLDNPDREFKRLCKTIDQVRREKPKVSGGGISPVGEDAASSRSVGSSSTMLASLAGGTSEDLGVQVVQETGDGDVLMEAISPVESPVGAGEIQTGGPSKDRLFSSAFLAPHGPHRKLIVFYPSKFQRGRENLVFGSWGGSKNSATKKVVADLIDVSADRTKDEFWSAAEYKEAQRVLGLDNAKGQLTEAKPAGRKSRKVVESDSDASYSDDDDDDDSYSAENSSYNKRRSSAPAAGRRTKAKLR